MWPGTDMVARVLIEERERNIARADVMRTLRAEEESLYVESEKGPFWAASVVLAILLIALIGDAILA
jgi:hypothetical protein